MNLSKVALGLGIASLVTAGAALLIPSDATAYDCTSPDPAQWPPSSKPYFLIIVDTSGSMSDGNSDVGSTDSCGYGTKRTHHARCAVRNTINAFAGQVNFGLAGYAVKMNGCGANCSDNCLHNNLLKPPGDNNSCGPVVTEGTLGATTIHRGAEFFVPVWQDHYWSDPPDPSNVPSLLSYVDNNCTGDIELAANSNTPIAGALHQANAYLTGSYTDLFSGAAVPTPIGTLIQGERSCRPINIILITDGDETCDSVLPTPITGGCRSGSAYDNTANGALAMYEADRLRTNGVTVGGQNYKVKTSVIGFAGASTTALNNIASCGGTGSSYSTSNEAQLAQALSDIIGGSVSPESCNNGDDNCNGCVDEGYAHYCNVSQTCCAWTTTAQRDACLTSYTNSLVTAPPNGDLTKLPCTTVAQQQASSSWLCFDPKDKCDSIDNNCQDGVDENQTKCGNPLHCPSAETCNGQDDNCNGVVDEGVCGSCTPTGPEACDGIDNDCVGGIDNGIAPVACGLPSPANCAGTQSCVGGTFTACNNNPQAEICDGIDNNCNGIIDDGVPPAACVPAGTPAGLNYGPNSQCKMGTKQCGSTQCVGFVGPSAEICDGIDNDCDGSVDETPVGVGLQCGVSTAPCSPGLTACVAGALVCQGGTQPKPEVCNGLDDNCNGQTDESLTDAPQPGTTGCWNIAGNVCSHQSQCKGSAVACTLGTQCCSGTCTGGFCTAPSPAIPPLTWSPPPGGSCNGVGALTQPCSTGVQVCAGSMGWVCQGGKAPSPEVCDGVDNDCNGMLDNGSFPTEGNLCGINAPNVTGCTKGDCAQGVIDCVGGILDCVGDVVGSPEICNGKDDNCDGTCDNGIPIGGACVPAYDTTQYPGDRSAPPCQPGHFQCDGMGGLICVGGLGPQPEVCDGLDNDCDGAVDESGPAPNGIDGTANPFPPPSADLGDVCGTNEGQCSAGNYACVAGQFACLGAQGPTPEQCDCQDNDCDGTTDNPNPGNMPPLCSTGKDCVNSAGACQCAAKCGNGEFPCPGGQICTQVNSSQTGMPLGKYCLVDNCGDCSTKTVTNSQGKVVCAPAGTTLANCEDPPECVCKGQTGCAAPCNGVSCTSPLVCTNYGPDAGKCVVDNCFNQGCHACDQACNDLGDCVDNPCKADTCNPDQVCKPSDDFSTSTCVGTCAGVMCDPGSTCHDGQCVATCDPACAPGTTCDETQDPPACVTDQCGAGSCPNGGCCDPLSGQCGACPCEGIVCPDQQECQDGECVTAMGTGGGQTTSSTTSTSSTTTGAGGGSTVQAGAGGGTGGDDEKGVWGLATGGGGCSCSTTDSGPSDAGLAMVALGGVITALRRRKKSEKKSPRGGARGEVQR